MRVEQQPNMLPVPGKRTNSVQNCVRVVGAFQGGAPPPACRTRQGGVHSLCKSSKPHGAAFETKPVAIKPLPWSRVVPRRRAYRQCRQAMVNGQLTLATFNTQGLVLCKVEHRLKLVSIIEAARQGSWQITSLTDLGGQCQAFVTLWRIEEFLCW